MGNGSFIIILIFNYILKIDINKNINEL